jgi:hypothetical protein
MSRFFGPVRQLAHVVRDIDAALPFWIETMRIGPFFTFEAPPDESTIFRSKPCRAHTRFALAQSGALQIELVQPVNDAPSPFREFLDAGREGEHHVAFWTDTFDRDMAKYAAAGFATVMFAAPFGRKDCRLAFLDTDAAPGPMIEISETSGPKGELFRKIAAAGHAWDGRNPIRAITDL